MTVPLNVTFQGIAKSPALEADIAERLESLTRFNSRISECRATVSQEGHQSGMREIVVSLILTVPNDEIVISRRNVDGMQACAEAFDAAKRSVRHANEKLHG